MQSHWTVTNEDGQTMAEYAVVLTVITLAVLVALGIFSGNIQRGINAVGSLVSMVTG
jgi:Flp pilus assembly pilin Flp